MGNFSQDFDNFDAIRC